MSEIVRRVLFGLFSNTSNDKWIAGSLWIARTHYHQYNVPIRHRPKILFFSEIATPYRQPLFSRLCRSENWDLRIVFLVSRQRDRDWRLGTDPALANRTDVLPGFQLGSIGAHHVFLNWGIRDYLVSQNPDLTVISGYAQPAFQRVRRFCVERSVPYITLTESHLKKKRSPLIECLKRRHVERFYRAAAAHLSMGKASREFVAHYGADANTVFDFPNTIDVEAYANAVNNLRREGRDRKAATLGSKGQNILYVGQLAPWKGVDVLLRAFLGLAAKHPDATLHLIGEGSERSKLERLASSIPSGKIHFHGFVQPHRLPAFYAASDVLVLPSRQETWGVVLIEAMAAGLPVISSDAVGAAEDLVVNGRTGFTFPSGDAKTLENHLELLISDADLRSILGRGAYDLAKDWSYERAIRGFERAVERALRPSADRAIAS